MNWINVKDRLPETGEDVLCWVCKFGELENWGYWIKLHYSIHRKEWVGYNNGISYDYENNVDYYRVTHWCEIEEPKN